VSGGRERVVIVGGGVTGALSAVRLAERGFEVTILEKAGLGNGSSSRSMAGIRAQFSVAETIVGMLYAQWYYCHFHELLATPADQRQPVIKQNGYLFCYDDPACAEVCPDSDARARAEAAWEQGQTSFALQRDLGVGVELLAPDEIARRWPHVRAELMIGATFCPNDGFLMPTVIYGEGFRRAQELGATLHQRAEVLGAEQRGGRLVAVETTSGRFEADLFVNCTNAWAPRLSRRLGGMELAITPSKRYLYHFRSEQTVLPPEAWDRLPMSIFGMGNGIGAHYRPDGDRLIFAGTSPWQLFPDFADEDQDLILPGYDHRVGIDNFGITLMQALAVYAPDLIESGGLVATTSGFYGLSADGSPLIGFDASLPNLIHAAGFSGHGVMHAPISALLVEALATGETAGGRVRLPEPFGGHGIDLATFDPGRDFSRTAHEATVL
jgi:glycine/D-amino acid oxidase-like deaminating enzyme